MSEFYPEELRPDVRKALQKFMMEALTIQLVPVYQHALDLEVMNGRPGYAHPSAWDAVERAKLEGMFAVKEVIEYDQLQQQFTALKLNKVDNYYGNVLPRSSITVARTFKNVGGYIPVEPFFNIHVMSSMKLLRLQETLGWEPALTG